MGDSVGSCERKSSNWKASIRKSSNQLRISLGLTLGNDMSSGEDTSETSIPSIGETSITKSRGSKDGSDRWVVDERGGGADYSGGSGEDGGVGLGRPLAVESESVISNSNRDGMGSNLGGDFCGGDLNILYNWDMGYSVSSG